MTTVLYINRNAYEWLESMFPELVTLGPVRVSEPNFNQFQLYGPDFNLGLVLPSDFQPTALRKA